MDSMAGEHGGVVFRAVRSGNPRFRRYLWLGGVMEDSRMVTNHRTGQVAYSFHVLFRLAETVCTITHAKLDSA